MSMNKTCPMSNLTSEGGSEGISYFDLLRLFSSPKNEDPFGFWFCTARSLGACPPRLYIILQRVCYLPSASNESRSSGLVYIARPPSGVRGHSS